MSLWCNTFPCTCYPPMTFYGTIVYRPYNDVSLITSKCYIWLEGIHRQGHTWTSTAICLHIHTCSAWNPEILINLTWKDDAQHNLLRSRCLPVGVCLFMCMSDCLTACMFVCLSVCISVCLFGCVRVCMSIFLHVCMAVCLFVCLYVSLSVYLFGCIYVRVSVCPLVYMYYVCLFVCMYVCMYVWLSVYFFVCLSVLSILAVCCMYVHVSPHLLSWYGCFFGYSWRIIVSVGSVDKVCCLN